MTLTPRERQIVYEIVRGSTNAQIAYALSISPHTVADRIKDILTKLDLRNRTEIAVHALRHGMIAEEIIP